MKYFVVSLHRSGTRSMTNYLNALGITAKHWPVEHEGINLEEKIIGRETDRHYIVQVLRPIIERFQGVADVPIPILYRELFFLYPEARFIFLYRNAFEWVRSIRKHYRKPRKSSEFRPFVRAVYWPYFDWHPRRLDEVSDTQLIWMHGQHMADIISFFQKVAPTKLGLFDLCDGGLGKNLAAFLTVKTSVPFPFLNSTRPPSQVS